MKVTLQKVGAAAFDAESQSGGTLTLDGSPEIGGEGGGVDAE